MSGYLEILPVDMAPLGADLEFRVMPDCVEVWIGGTYARAIPGAPEARGPGSLAVHLSQWLASVRQRSATHAALEHAARMLWFDARATPGLAAVGRLRGRGGRA